MASVGLYDEALCYEDWDMWLRLAARYRFAFTPRIGACYRIVATSMTRTVLYKWGRPQIFSAMRIAAKLVETGRLGRAALSKKKSEVSRFAVRLCAMGDPDCASHLALAQHIDPRPITWALSILAARKPTRKVAIRLASAWVLVRNRIEWYAMQIKSRATRGGTR
jgi:hypothetical protein